MRLKKLRELREQRDKAKEAPLIPKPTLRRTMSC